VRWTGSFIRDSSGGREISRGKDVGRVQLG
jgi:hypothetical protein